MRIHARPSSTSVTQSAVTGCTTCDILPFYGANPSGATANIATFGIFEPATCGKNIFSAQNITNKTTGSHGCVTTHLLIVSPVVPGPPWFASAACPVSFECTSASTIPLNPEPQLIPECLTTYKTLKPGNTGPAANRGPEQPRFW